MSPYIRVRSTQADVARWRAWRCIITCNEVDTAICTRQIATRAPTQRMTLCRIETGLAKSMRISPETGRAKAGHGCDTGDLFCGLLAA
jgi:hypothetical protein